MSKYTKFVTHTSEQFGGELCDAYKVEEISRADALIEDTKLADHAFILRVMGHLLGKVLTTVEATTASEKQAKAIKDIIRGHFSEEIAFVSSMLYNQSELDKVAEEAVAELDDDDFTTVEVEQMLGVK